MTSRHAASPRWSRTGLPAWCGVKLADGRECRKRAGPFGACEDHADPACRPRVPACLDPLCFGDYYRAWLVERGREPVLPDDLQRFLWWWRTTPTVDKVEVPWPMDLDRLKTWWLVWCRVARRERLIPFDLALFIEWWQVS